MIVPSCTSTNNSMTHSTIGATTDEITSTVTQQSQHIDVGSTHSRHLTNSTTPMSLTSLLHQVDEGRQVLQSYIFTVIDTNCHNNNIAQQGRISNQSRNYVQSIWDVNDTHTSLMSSNSTGRSSRSLHHQVDLKDMISVAIDISEK
jgi:hypothetical protein